MASPDNLVSARQRSPPIVHLVYSCEVGCQVIVNFTFSFWSVSKREEPEIDDPRLCWIPDGLERLLLDDADVDRI